MTKTNVAEAKAKLSEYLDRAVAGERIVICRHNRPVAELRAVEEPRVEPRPVGPLPGRPRFDVPPSFFEPLPDDELDLWEGVTAPSRPPRGPRKPRAARVAVRTPAPGRTTRASRRRRS